jgi:putative transposase
VPEDGDLGSDVLSWKQLYGGLLPSEVKKLRQLGEENARLRKVVADLTLDNELLQEVIRRKL